MGYEQIDSTINEWVKQHSFTLFTAYEGFPDIEFRAIYLSSPQGECCQISIEKPNIGKVAINARDIETKMDEELNKNWLVEISDLEAGLENAVSFVQSWFSRGLTHHSSGTPKGAP